MKLIPFTNKFIFLFIVLIISFSLGCDKSDDLEDSCVTFLECNDSMYWKWVEDDGYHIYFYFNDNLTNAMEWYHDGGDCYDSNKLSDFEFDIIENSKNKFVVNIYGDIGQNNDGYEKVTFTMSGERMTLRLEEHKDNGELEIISGELIKPLNIVSLDICG